LSRSLFSDVPIDFCGHLQLLQTGLCYMDCVIWTEASETRVPDINAIMTFFTKYGPTPCDKNCRSEHQTLFPLFGEDLERDYG